MAGPESRRDDIAGAAAKLLIRAGFWIPLLICTYLALIPEPPEHPVFRVSDLVLHAGAFIYLTLALVIGQQGRGNTDGQIYLRSLLLMLAYGLFIELAQSLVPQRTAELKDLLVDLLGIGIGLVAARIAARRVDELVYRSVAWLLVRR